MRHQVTCLQEITWIPPEMWTLILSHIDETYICNTINSFSTVSKSMNKCLYDSITLLGHGTFRTFSHWMDLIYYGGGIPVNVKDLFSGYISKLKNLKTIRNYNNSHEDDLFNFFTPFLHDTTFFPNLCELDIVHIPFMTILINAPLLTILKLQWCSSISNESLRNCTKLKELSLENCPGITYSIFEFGYMTGLESLTLKCRENQRLLKGLDKLVNLRKLELSNEWEYDDDLPTEEEEEEEYTINLDHLTSLRKLRIEDSRIYLNVTSFSTLKKLTSLTYLHHRILIDYQVSGITYINPVDPISMLNTLQYLSLPDLHLTVRISSPMYIYNLEYLIRGHLVDRSKKGKYSL